MNNKQLLDMCLSSIYKNTKEISFEIVVIDNVSSDGSVEMVREKYPKVKIIENKLPLGFSENHNQVLKRFSSRYVVILNDDTILLNDAFDKMVKFMDMHNDVGILGCKIFSRDMSLQFSARKFPSLDIKILAAGMFHNTFLGRFFPNNQFTKEYLLLTWEHNDTREVDWVSGCCMMIRKETIDEIGVLDEQFFMFVEDVDFCFRAKKNNWLVFYLHTAEILHFGGQSTSRKPVKMIIEHHKSMYKFYKKHYLRGGKLRPIIISGLFIRCCIAILQNRVKFFRDLLSSVWR